MPTQTAENYLKAIYRLTESTGEGVNTNALAADLDTKASSVTDMLKKLSDQGLVEYQKYKGARLTTRGRTIAVKTIRKHRLWEVFLVNHLNFKWDEVHELAEELEHIDSDKLINNLEQFLGNPKTDPHGDPIPDKDGRFKPREDISLAEMEESSSGVLVGVREHTPAFLQYLESVSLLLGARVQIVKKFDYDDSRQILINGNRELTLSVKAATNLSILPDNPHE